MRKRVTVVFDKMLESPKSWQELASKAHWPPTRTGLQCAPERIGKRVDT
jgi:hypothetical protein